MKKRNLKNLQLNKAQVSKLSGGNSNEPGNGDDRLTVNDQTCQGDCASRIYTCISEYQTACEPIKTYEYPQCADHVKTINPATRYC